MEIIRGRTTNCNLNIVSKIPPNYEVEVELPPVQLDKIKEGNEVWVRVEADTYMINHNKSYCDKIIAHFPAKPELHITCDFCNKPLTELGGLVFSPPIDGKCKKIHLCKSCFDVSRYAKPPKPIPNIGLRVPDVNVKEECCYLCGQKWSNHTPEIHEEKMREIQGLSPIVEYCYDKTHYRGGSDKGPNVCMDCGKFIDPNFGAIKPLTPKAKKIEEVDIKALKMSGYDKVITESLNELIRAFNERSK